MRAFNPDRFTVNELALRLRVSYGTAIMLLSCLSETGGAVRCGETEGAGKKPVTLWKFAKERRRKSDRSGRWETEEGRS